MSWFQKSFSLLVGCFLLLLVGLGPVLEPLPADAAPRAQRKGSARRTGKKVPARPQSTLAGTGLQPHTNPLLADPVMGRLRTASQRFLDSPTTSSRHALLRFASKHANHQAGALAYLALGYRAIEEGELDDAVLVLRAGSNLASPVRDYLEYYLGRALRRQGRHKEALQMWSGFEQRHPKSPLRGRARLAQAESLLAAGSPAATVRFLKASGSALRRPQADLLLGRAYVAAGNKRAAIEAYRQAYYLYPASQEAKQAEQEIQRLRRRVKGRVPAARAVLHKQRAERLFEARRFRAAQQAYKQLAAVVSDAEREDALVRAAASAYRGRRRGTACALLGRLRPTSAAAAAERLYFLGECHRRRGRETAFRHTVNRLGRKFPDSSWHGKALFSAANYYFLKRDEARYERYYSTLYEKFPSSKDAQRAHWRVAWRHYRSGRSESARRLLEQQVLRYPRSTQVAAALYWLGRLAEKRQPAIALAYFRKTSEHFPQYFYGTIARQKLAGLIGEGAAAGRGGGLVVPVAAAPSTAQPSNVAAVLAAVPTYRPEPIGVARPAEFLAHRLRAQALEAAWLLDLAALELRSAANDHPEFRHLLLDLARLEHNQGKFLGAIRRFRKVFPNYLAYPPEELDQKHWELVFPLPWWSLVEAEAERRGLDPYLLAALIRQESAFQPQAVSRAGARGLMQLLPSTARLVARKMGRPRPSRTQLFDPQTNVELGTQYLFDVLQRFDGRLEAALASYNAGPGRVDRWLARGNYRDPAEFIESIPFTETRNYVQAVLRNVAIYRRLYADGQ